MALKSNKLGLLTTKIGSGITPRGGQSVYQNLGTHLIRSQNIYNHKFEKNGLVCISQEIAEKMKSVEIMNDDVLINITGDSVARVYLVPDEILPARVNQHVCILRTKPELNPHYLYYFLINPTTQNHLLSIAGIGGTRNALTKEMLYNLIIEYPDLPTQEKIVKQLNTIKNKIITLENQNHILEETAQTIFKSWFVDFDGITEFEDSELGKIPKGWKAESLDQNINFLNGLALQKFRPMTEEFLPVIKIKEMNEGFSNKTDKAGLHIDPKYIVKNGDVLFSWSGSLELMLWYHGDGALNQHLFKVTSEKFKSWFFYQWINFHLSQFRRIAAGKRTTMGHIQRHHLAEAKILVPPPEILEKHNSFFQPMIDQILSNKLESESLTKIRDTLLPKLMSGEIRV